MNLYILYLTFQPRFSKCSIKGRIKGDSSRLGGPMFGNAMNSSDFNVNPAFLPSSFDIKTFIVTVTRQSVKKEVFFFLLLLFGITF